MQWVWGRARPLPALALAFAFMLAFACMVAFDFALRGTLAPLPLYFLSACIAGESSRRCALMSMWLPTEIELNHYSVRSRDEFIARRSWAARADGVDVKVQLEERDAATSVCSAPQRIRRFIPGMKSWRATAWRERDRHEVPPGFSRIFFLTAVAEVNLAMPEDEYLLEWIDFHTLVGFDHFVIYDAKNLTSTRVALQEYTSSGIVDLIPCRVGPTGSCLSAETLSRSRKQQFEWRKYAVASLVRDMSTYWIALMDVDEFFFPRRFMSLRDILIPESHPTGISGFFIWQLNFGSSGWQSKPDLLQIEAYNRSACQRDWNGKSIARSDAISLNGSVAYEGHPHLLLSGNEPGVRRCEANFQDFQGNIQCIENPVRMFDVVGVCLCLTNFFLFVVLAVAPALLLRELRVNSYVMKKH